MAQPRTDRSPARGWTVAGSIGIIAGLALGGGAAALAFSPVTAGTAQCGTIVRPVYDEVAIGRCLDASAARRVPAIAATGLALGALFTGIGLSLHGIRLEHEMVRVDA